MKIVVFGGTGYIGSHVVEQLILAGEVPVCPVRGSSDTQFLKSIKADIQICDFSKGSLSEIMQSAEVVINCLARPELHLSLEEHRKVDVELTSRVLQQSIKAGVKRFIQLSTVQVYGFHRPSEPIDEDYPVSGDYHFNQVAIEREQALKVIAENSGIELVMLRASNTIGARDPNFLQIVEAHKKGFFPIFKRGVRFSCVDTRDVGRAMVWLTKQEQLQHDCYLLKGFDVGWLQIKEKLDRIMGKRSRVIFLPEKIMMILGFVFEKLFPYGSNPPLIRFSVKVMSTNTLFDSSRIENEGFSTCYEVDQMLESYCRSLLK